MLVQSVNTLYDAIDILGSIRSMRTREPKRVLPTLFPVAKPEAVKIEAKVAEVTKFTDIGVTSGDAKLVDAPLKDVVFEPYVCQRLRIEGAMPHPTALVESAAMASVLLPVPTYSPCLPRELIETGALSDAQLEAIVYAGQAHQQWLEPQLLKNPLTGEEKTVSCRKGFYVADGTGTGKSRVLAGIILDSFARGETKAIWMSKTPKLIKDAIEQWVALGGKKQDIISLSKITAGVPITAPSGILFVSYGVLKSSARGSGTDEGLGDPSKGKKGKSRMQQIVDWVGEDFQGVVCGDEIHVARNAME